MNRSRRAGCVDIVAAAILAAVAVPAEYPTTWAAWQAACVEPGHTITDFGDLLDPDADRIPNLLEYVMGTHPLSRDANPVWSGRRDLGGTRHLALEYPVVSSRTDVSTQAMRSTTLGAWSSAGVITGELGNQAGRSLRRSSIPMEGAVPPAAFLRLEAGR